MSVLSIILVGTVLTALLSRGLERDDLFAVFLGHAAHVVSAFAVVLVYEDFYGKGDMFVYFEDGGLLARLLESDLDHWLPRVVDLLLQREPSLPIRVYATKGPTGSMIALAGLTRYVFGGSLHAVGLAFATFASVGSLALFRAFRESLEPEYRRAAQLSALLIPSVVFWSSGIFKEAIALGALGFLVLGLLRALHDRWMQAVPLVALGIGGIGITKPYMFLALAAAVGAWYYWQRAQSRSATGVVRIRPLYLAGAALLVTLLVLGFSEIFPRFAPSNLVAETATIQEATYQTAGGSTYQMGDPEDRSLAGQLLYAPLAVFTALYRPLLVEARNSLQLVSALEMTAFVVLTVLAIVRHGFGGVVGVIGGRPLLVMSVVFLTVFGLGVGLATTNLGALSRYRIPMMPFYLLVLMVVARKEAPSVEPRPAQAPAPDRLPLGRRAVGRTDARV